MVNATIKIFSLISLAVAIFLTGCDTVSTVKHDPVPASQVFLYETKGDFMVMSVPHSRNVTATMYPVRVLTQHSQYLGKVLWSGVLPELYVPESLYDDDGLTRIYNQPQVQDVPERMKTEMRARAGALGANMVIFDRWLCNYRWIMQDGKFQPTYLFYGKAYWNDAIANFALTNKIGLKQDDALACFNRGGLERVKGDRENAIADLTKAIELKPDDFLAYNNRINVNIAKGDMGGALADYDKVIRLMPDNASVYEARGKLKNEMNNWGDAIADFNKAIKLNPNFDAAYVSRALAKIAQGDLDGAMADYNKAIEIDPANAEASHKRGCLYYNSHEFTNALVDFRRSCELQSWVQSYSYFRVWLIRARNGETEAATSELKDYCNYRQTGTPGDWQSKIGSFLTGQLTEPDFFRAAENSDNKKDSEQHCEAYFYAGSKRLIEGDKATATDYFEKCVATGIKTSTEYYSAAAELKFLKETN